MIRALLWKEWREQRWRFALTALVLTTLSAGLVRAQLMTTPEAVLFIFGPLGLILTIFLAMGTVATEREDGTWSFLIARPTRLATILRAKWAIGAASLATALLLAGAAAHIAASSRGLFDLPTQLGSLGNSGGWLWRVVATSALSLLAAYSVLFVFLTRARTELHAGLGGLLISVAMLAWMAQYFTYWMLEDWGGPAPATAVRMVACLGPLSPFVELAYPQHVWRLLSFAAAVGWIFFSLCFIDRFVGDRDAR